MDPIRRQTLMFVAVIVLAAAGCNASVAPSVGSGPITTEDQAVAAVVAHEPRFAGISQRDPDMIGQANWYEVQPASGVGAFLVTMRLGWGDCPAGCIDEHRWVYAVGPTGEVTLQSESGAAVPPDVWPAPGDGVGTGTGLFITGVAGPTCPVEQVPPDPACASRPVVGAMILIRDRDGNDVGTATLDAAGSVSIDLPPGVYVVHAAEVQGLMGTPEPQQAVVVDGFATPVVLAYDTGIR